MKKLSLVAALSALICAPAVASQAIDLCVQAAKEARPGTLVKIESIEMEGKSIYELEVRDENGFEYELMCDIKSGKIVETEGEAESPMAEAFKSKMKVVEEDAIKTALKAYPGKVEEVEYELEENGDVSYEIDIMQANGTEMKVEVDAVSGKIIEAWKENWEIGIESNERR